jgi:esterase/lipase superfamily enzyme
LDRDNYVSGDVMLNNISVLGLETLTDHLIDLVGAKEDKSALVFIHGYAMDFERAAQTMAKLTYELSYMGAPVLYSWPSNSSPAAYTGDMVAMDWSAPHLQEFLNWLASVREVETIHLVAHSLGNRGLLTALRGLINKHPGKWKFGEIVLIAPDVDVDIFVRDIAPQITQTSSRITLYVSSVDFPLYLSRKLNLYPRVGDSNTRPLVISGIETVDTSGAVTMEMGHAYFRKDPEVLSDLFYLINERLGADQRSTLTPIELPEGRYWQLKKDEPAQSTR